MRKKIFLEKYFFEMLFAGMSVLTLLLALKGAMCYVGISSFMVILFAVVLQVFFGCIIMHASNRGSVLRKPLTVWIWYFTVFILSVFFVSLANENRAGELAVFIILILNSMAIRSYFFIGETIARLPGAFNSINNSLNPIQRYGNVFDVLCEVNGEMLRLPFEKRAEGSVIGIFPFMGTGEYIELAEYPNKRHTDKDVDCARLLDIDFCTRIAKVKNQLNEHLQQLNSPVLDGAYLADSPYMRGCGWIVGFSAQKDTINSDYYGGKTPAKLRYMGVFEKICEV